MRLEIGRVQRAHGLRGEVVVRLTSDREGRLAPGATVWAGEDARTVAASRRHQDRWIVHFEGVRDRTAAEALRGAVLTADTADDTDAVTPAGVDGSDGAGRVPVEGEAAGDAADETLWVHELIGAEVVLADGTVVGRVEAVQDNPAHDLLVLDSGALVPVVFLTDASGRPERLVIDPPDGLLELATGGDRPGG